MWAVSLTTLVLFCVLLVCTFTAAVAAEADPPSAGSANGPWDDRLLGDLGGLRSWMARYGAKLDLVQTDEVLGNPTGGLRRGAIYEGLTDLSLGLDFRPYFHWRGRSVRTRLPDPRPRPDRQQPRQPEHRQRHRGEPHHPASRAVVRAAFRRLAAHPARSAERPGSEFLLSKAARLFVNGTFGWPTLPAVDLPSGGPGYPLGTPAVRLAGRRQRGADVLSRRVQRRSGRARQRRPAIARRLGHRVSHQ